jgi:hypothetical protein
LLGLFLSGVIIDGKHVYVKQTGQTLLTNSCRVDGFALLFFPVPPQSYIDVLFQLSRTYASNPLDMMGRNISVTGFNQDKTI